MAADKKVGTAVVTPADMDIFRLAKTNVNYFSDYYMRSPTSGTYWQRKPEPDDEDKAAAWQVMWSEWKHSGRPDKLFEWKGRPYKIQWDDDSDPIFWDHHGALFLPWQLQAYHCSQPEIVIIGGFGSSKTWFISAAQVARACMTPYYRGYSIAPKMIQANEVYRQITTTCANTPVFNRWLHVARTKPYPTIIFRNDYIGESTIECLSLEHDPEKVLTLEGDLVFVDQAEQFENLAEITRGAGSRLRGTVQGRTRLDKMYMVANSSDNPELWYMYDMADHDPKTYAHFNPSSYDNPYLTSAQLRNMERRVGGTKEAIDQYMLGKRPIGSGEHFTSDMIKKNLRTDLDATMEYQVALPDGHPDKTPGFIRQEADRVGIHIWEMPPEPGRHYVVVGDPGQGNPPGRNSGCVMVWDITDFPSKPAVLRSFRWTFGHGMYGPFLQTFIDATRRYKAKDRCAFDGTGMQKGFNELVFMQEGLLAEGIDLSGGTKARSLAAAKVFLGKGLMEMPYISHLVNQLTNYRLPDDRIPQDLVMALVMAAYFMRRFYLYEIDEEDGDPTLFTDYDYDPGGRDRWNRPYSPDVRYSRRPRG